MRILFAGYRQWGQDALVDLLKYLSKTTIKVYSVQTQDQLLQVLRDPEQKFDAVVLAGWSWIIPADLCDSNYIVGIHPSDLPDYAGGSPIQHQILDGLTETKCCLFRITSDLDGGGIILRTPLDLSGNMTDIFRSLKIATFRLTYGLIDHMRNNGCQPPPEEQQESRGIPRRRLQPEDSALDNDGFANMTARELYNFIRCREAPYPNVFVSDHTGVVRFTGVSFDEMDDDGS
jgi:methionyl-tRNA formyltransferase